MSRLHNTGFFRAHHKSVPQTSLYDHQSYQHNMERFIDAYAETSIRDLKIAQSVTLDKVFVLFDLIDWSHMTDNQQDVADHQQWQSLNEGHTDHIIEDEGYASYTGWMDTRAREYLRMGLLIFMDEVVNDGID